MKDVPKESDEKKKLWAVDASIFTVKGRAKLLARMMSILESIARPLILSLLLGYPLVLVLSGLLFGWIVFWGSLLGSVAVIGLLLKGLGYAKNFENWNPSLSRQLVTLTIGFLAVAGFYVGLFNYRALMLPLLFAVFVSVLILGILYRGWK